MPTLFQKIRLALRGWSRRREEAQRAFVEKSTGWAPPVHTAPSLPLGMTKGAIDMEGLCVAFLDDSGRIDYYLDTESGDVVDVRDGGAMEPPRYRRVPTRSEQSEAADRRAFAMKHQTLLSSVGSAESFRSALGKDRALERAWYNFKNDRAIAAIEKWLAQK